MNTQVLFKREPVGLPVPDDFELVETPIPEISDGEFLLKAHYLSLDPYMRMLMGGGWEFVPLAMTPGQVMVGRPLAEVVESNNPDYPVGTFVVGRLGWQTYAVSNGEGLDFKVTPRDGVPLTAYLGAAGNSGLTAWIGLNIIADAKPGDVVAVTAAAGSVGSVVGQLAKAMGCPAIGVAGGADKCALVTETFGFDACIDYKRDDLEQQLLEATPDGIDVYFDNVGGEVLDMMLARTNKFARIANCGVLSRYNATEEAYGLKNTHLFFDRQLRMRGFVTGQHADHWPEAQAELETLIADGRLVTQETVAHGMENAVDAFIGMLQGKNLGKQLVKLS